MAAMEREKMPIWERIMIEPDNENKKVFDLFIAFCCFVDIICTSYK